MNATRSELAASVLAALTRNSVGLPINNVQPVAEGEQNFVFTCSLQGEKSILKVTDSRHRSRAALETQLTMLSRLEHYAPNVVAPRTLGDGRPIVETEIAGISFYLVAYPYATGERARITKHGYFMGRALADLHAAMRRLPRYAFGEIGTGANTAKVRAAARTLEVSERFYATVLDDRDSDGVQLLHGDFNVVNVKLNGPTLAVFDFDNCVYGSPAYELANSLYMVLFDQVRQNGSELTLYHNFRQAFLNGYRGQNDTPFNETAIDAFISYRVLLLASWLQAPDDAPLFIKQSPPSWLATLQTFVQVYFESLTSEPKNF